MVQVCSSMLICVVVDLHHELHQSCVVYIIWLVSIEGLSRGLVELDIGLLGII